jgi:uncharacterized damage-inducible protein DinB
MSLQELKEWIQYHKWRTHKICDNLQEVDNLRFLQPLKGSFPSLSHLTGHIVSAESLWLARMNDQPEKFPKYEYFENPQTATDTWKLVNQKFSEKLNSLTEQELSGSFSYSNSSGKSFQNTFQEALMHIFDHSTYHIGQIAWIMRSMDIVPVSTNYIFYIREKQTSK